MGYGIDRNWLLLTYTDRTCRQVKVWDSGSGGMHELKTHLQPGKIFFGGFRVQGIMGKAGAQNTTTRSKFVAVFFCSQSAGLMQRARAGGHKGAVAQVLKGTHVDLHLTSRDELKEADVVRRLKVDSFRLFLW